MKVINETGHANDTKVLDDQGRDITGQLQLKRIVIEAGELNRVILHCEGVELDVVGDRADG